jgi:ribosomal protein S18 acetylase RimI-like enzyme
VSLTQRRFGPQDSLADLTGLLHEAYAAHAAAGRTFFASYQTAADTGRRIARGECWIVLDGESMVGTVTIAAPYPFPAGYPAPRPAGTYYQLAVAPAYQHRGLGRRLVALAEQRIGELAVRDVAIDTSTLATDLVAWYLKLGYHETGRWRWDVTNYESIVLGKRLDSSL